MTTNNSTKTGNSLGYWFFRLLALVEKHWFNAFVIFFVLHVFLFKEVSIQVSMQSIAEQDPTSDQHIIAASKKEALMVSAFIPGEREADEEDFSNLAFVLNPRLAESENISRSVVKKKMEVCKRYVERFESTARMEQKKFGIPASITLAQGLLESDAGGSLVAQEFNNHFNIRCPSDCDACPCKRFISDGQDQSYRTFKTPWESFRQHSLILTAKPYQKLKDLERKDFKAWARGLAAAGYSKDPDYTKKLITIIEMLELGQYDR